MQSDLDQFLSYLEDADLSIEEKRAFLRQVWRVMKNFADLAFEFDTSQQAIKAKEQNEKMTRQPSEKCIGFNSNLTIDHR